AGATRKRPLANAFADAANAPKQPFFVSWLWLVVIALALFVISQVVWSSEFSKTPDLGFVSKFALRFSVAYWLLYSLPAPFTSLLPYVGNKLATSYQWVVDKVVRWMAENLMGIDHELVAPNGSGDTTFAYINVLICFLFALAVAAIWSVVDRRKTECVWTKDLLRSYLRYVLAFTMLGYGLAKLGTVYNQFPEPDVTRLSKTYGDSSPMGLVWTFMGSSRAYTTFAGLGEVVGALLLIWRRTTTIGAMVVFGVMLNIMMLNFCYDVPVKQYSAHLLCMALYLLLPEANRLANVLFWNRPTEEVELGPPYTNSITIWIQRGIKAAVIILGIGLPVYSKIKSEVDFARKSTSQPAFFDSYEVEEFKRDGEVVPPILTDSFMWRSVTFQRRAYGFRGEPGPVDILVIGLMNKSAAGAEFAISEDESTLTVNNRRNALIPNEITLDWQDDDSLVLSGTTPGGEISVKLRRRGKDGFLLMNRGFRWISEVPFNR
ncbi:hypothetical protein N9242_03625, partial [Vicingaceae bacterium]|nr:hypothetical protein [Vicingaceae bacterium]